MNLLLAHGGFCLMQDRGDLDGWSEVVAYPYHPQAPLVMAAAASLSGQLDDLPDDCLDADLVAAAEHGATLVSIGVRSRNDWSRECLVVLDELGKQFLGLECGGYLPRRDEGGEP